MNNVSVRLVFDRKHVATKKRQSSVQMEVTYQRKRKYVGTGIKLYSDQWGKDLKVKNHPQSLVFNQKLNDMVSGYMILSISSLLKTFLSPLKDWNGI